MICKQFVEIWLEGYIQSLRSRRYVKKVKCNYIINSNFTSSLL